MFEPRYVLFIQFFFVMTLSVIHFVSVLKEVEGTRFVLIQSLILDVRKTTLVRSYRLISIVGLPGFNPLIQNDQNVIFKCSLAII